MFFEDVSRSDDAFHDKALEGLAMFALNQGEVCTCPGRALVQASVYDQFLPATPTGSRPSCRATHWTPRPCWAPQASNDQLEKILSSIRIGTEEGARLITR